MINLPKSGIDLSFDPSFEKKGEFIVFDVEATGMISNSAASPDNSADMPRVIQISWILFDREGNQLSSHNRYIIQDKPIPPDSITIHGINDNTVSERGELPERVWKDFINDLDNSDYIVAHNIDYDVPVIEAELFKLGILNPFAGKKKICTMTLGKDICRIPDEDGAGYRYPSLEAMYNNCFNTRISEYELPGLHDACFDTIITAKILFYLLKTNKIILEDAVSEPFKLNSKTYNNNRVKNRDFFNKIILPTLITIVLFILTIFLIIIPRFKSNVMDDKREMIKELTNSAWSVLEKFESDERKGLLTRAEAQKQAIDQIQSLRYGEDNKDYFWITDMHPIMVMHPYRTDLQGQNLDQFSDPHGKKLFLEFVEVVKANNQGYVDYMWQWKDDSKQIVPKLSYVKGFKPWGWIIGTGIYIEDVKREIRSLTHSLILISLFISLIMVLMLALIMQQSMKIEEARGDAENKLLDSMEKYKTLVQATTEGLIMMIDNKIIFSNPRIQQLTGYNNEEISGRSFLFMLDDTNSIEIMNIFRENVITDGQFEVILKTKEDVLKEVLLTVSSISISEKNGKILVIKDVTSKDKNSLKIDDYQQLISNYDLGFIKLLLDAKGRILTANDTAARILGYNSVTELTSVSFLALFVNNENGKSFITTLIQDGNIRDEGLLLRRKDGAEVIVSVSLMVISNETEQMICEGIFEDVTQKVKQNKETDTLIAEMKTGALFVEQPIARYTRPLFSINMNDSIKKAEKLMSVKKTDVLSVITDNDEQIGIITFSDIRERVVFKGINPETKIFEIMSSPVISTDNNSSINDAILLASEKNIDHIVVTEGGDKFLAVLHTKDIPYAFQQTQLYIENHIKTAGSTDELKNLFTKVIHIARPLIDQNIQARTTGRLIGAISGKITSRIIELVIEEMGTPPVDFVFIALGSEGRLEQTLETDQDNAVIFRDVPEKDQLYVHNYFTRLSRKVCDSLNEVGFNFCKGMVMAKNPRWCMPLQTWKNYFTSWIDTPEPQNILDISIFFDFRPVYGNFDLANELRRHVSNVIQDKQSFFYNFAENVINFKTAVGFTGNIITEKRDNKELFDLKYAITPVVMFARIYALFKNINKTNTVDRLTILNEEKVITNNDFQETLFGYNFLMQLRYKHQIKMASANLPPNNLIDIRELTDIENAIVKKVFSSVSRLQTMLSIDFKKTIA